ncbi:uncharacterized protein LOC134665573 isoform X2 [Cydia fagiglandana]|uniref:uncharacterized protein LOC134665573 isoform X2 n=1 Tax=Cydia fagiglandana TaxID=1458189 RepID=UPI002FEE4B60
MSDTEQKEAIAARGRAKGSITRLKNSFDREALINSPIELVLAKKTRLLEAFREYERLTSKVASLFSSPPATLATDDEEVEDNYILLLAQLESIINVIRLRDNPPQASPSVSVKSENLKLPRVVIKTFTGKYTEYYEFTNMFTAMIDKCTSFSAVQKLYYLKGFLSDEPLDLIKNLPLEDNSYPEALRLLKERYDNKVRITQEHVNALLDMPTITRSNVTNLRNFISVVKQHLAALQNLGEPVDKWDAIIICILSKKIDLPTYRAFQLERDKNVSPTVKEFLGYVEKRALAFENTDVKGPSQSFVSRPEAAQAKLSAHQPQRQCLYYSSDADEE